MFSHVKSCVKHCNKFSDVFEYAVGVRQGEVISPILVSLFLEMFLQGNTNSRILINDIVLIILLFADDMAIFENNPEDLQNNLNVLHDYCNTWGLEVNVDKTKIMVFRKKGG